MAFKTVLIILPIFVAVALCGDFYLGMFKKNDYLVAQDRLYKERIPYRSQAAKYGRIFKCPITYVRVVDRLGYGGGPSTKIIRGGLKRKYVVLLISAYNKPISVNVYVGCENKRLPTKRTTRTTKTEATTKLQTTTNGNGGTTKGVSTPESGDLKPSTDSSTTLNSSTTPNSGNVDNEPNNDNEPTNDNEPNNDNEPTNDNNDNKPTNDPNDG